MTRTTGDRRSEILHLASQLFARNGFHGTSMDDLGAAAGLSGPALYRYFAGKEAILSAMLVDISERLLDGGQQRVSAHPDPSARLESLVQFHVDFALDDPDLIDVQARDMDAMAEDDRRLVRRLQARYVSLWVEALREVYPALTAESARSAAHAAFGLINSTPHSNRLTRPEMSALLQAMALGGFEAAAKA
jgi:AcrR family transcriptional regulator